MVAVDAVESRRQNQTPRGGVSETGASFEAITFALQKLVTRPCLSASVVLCGDTSSRNARRDDQVQRINAGEYDGPCCIYLGSVSSIL